MNRDELFSKAQVIFMVIIALIAIIIMVDFKFSSKTINAKVISKERVLENKQSTGRNYYYAKKLVVKDYVIQVSEDFANQTQVDHSLDFDVSLLFNEINKVTNLNTGSSEKYTFRWMTGGVIPFVVLIILWFGYKRRDKLNTLVFVAEVVLIIDFVFLLN